MSYIFFKKTQTERTNCKGSASGLEGQRNIKVVCSDPRRKVWNKLFKPVFLENVIYLWLIQNAILSLQNTKGLITGQHRITGYNQN